MNCKLSIFNRKIAGDFTILANITARNTRKQKEGGSYV